MYICYDIIFVIILTCYLIFLDDPPPYIHGVRINSPHYLCKIKLENNSDTRYTLVISQYEKTHTIYYTLRAYATCPFKLWQIPQLYKYEKEVNYNLFYKNYFHTAKIII